MKKRKITPALRKLLFAGSVKNESAPQIFIILCSYTVITTLYTWAFFSLHAMLVRFGLSLVIVIAYVIIERSPMSSLGTAFLSPIVIVSILIFGAIYFRGDFLIFTYNCGIAFISLTYLRPKGLAAYIAFSSAVFIVILFVFRINLLGPAFTAIYNILYFIVSVALNILTYIFCRSYVRALDALTDAKNEASLAAQAKGSFLASMSHEIRTPLNAIIGLTEAELRRELPQTSILNLRKIHNSGNLLMGIINDILDMSKIESGKFELVPSTYDIADMIYNTATLNMVHKGSKPINFLVAIDESIPRRLFGDDIRIKQILGNLLSNAFKYTREGSVELRAFWQPVSPINDEPCPNPLSMNKARITFEVADTGIGISDEDLKKLFSEYAQVNQKSTRGIEGTGLGLAICLGLVELMDGELSAQSEYGKGSVFTVRILQEIADGKPIGPETAAALKNFTYIPDNNELDVEYVPMPNARVLVVDDVEINLEVAAACLEPYELHVDCITNGAEAVQMIKNGPHQYDLIFMDHMMPGMDGVKTTQAIRKIGTQYAVSVPIIALTANVFADKDNKFIDNGFQGFLSKPIDLHKLDDILHTWLLK
ncbi:MAG: ATP-binding protein [Treponema sp.]|nr:ATP-binding protein [Treponema sp.]